MTAICCAMVLRVSAGKLPASLAEVIAMVTALSARSEASSAALLGMKGEKLWLVIFKVNGRVNVHIYNNATY